MLESDNPAVFTKDVSNQEDSESIKVIMGNLTKQGSENLLLSCDKVSLKWGVHYLYGGTT